MVRGVVRGVGVAWAGIVRGVRGEGVRVAAIHVSKW